MHCPHETTTLCHREGEKVCVSCGLVLDSLLTNAEIYPSTSKDNLFEQLCDHKKYKDYLELSNLCSRFHLCDDDTIGRIFQEYLKLEKHTKFRKDEMMTYVIYQFLKTEKLPRTLEDVSRLSFVSKKILWKIEKSHKKSKVSSSPRQLLETYYRRLQLSYKDKVAIANLIESFDDSKTSFAPSTICSGLTYVYCKRIGIRKSMNSICSEFGVSVMSCFRFLKYYSKNHTLEL